MSEIGVSIYQFTQSLRADILQAFKQYKSVAVHRSKIAFICNELHSFLQNMSNLEFGDEIATQTQCRCIRQANKCNSDFRELLTNLTEDNYFNFLLDKDIMFVSNVLNDYMKNFENSILESKIYEQKIFHLSVEQEIVDDQDDLKDLLKKLKDIKENEMIEFDDITKLDLLISGFESRIEELSNNGVPNQISDKEIEKCFEQFKEISFDHSEFELRKKLGSGGYSDVFLGYNVREKRFVAVKKILASNFDKKELEMLIREIKCASELNHFAILPFIGITIKQPFYLITEYMPGKSLFDRLHSNKKLTPTKKTIIALGVACGLAFIHSKNLVHRDIKSLNILLDADDYPKIGDFGLSRSVDAKEELMTGGIGTTQWMAPEIIDSKPYGKKADVYSYGILVWEILTEDIPFRGLIDYQIVVAILKDSRPLIPSTCPRKLAHFIKTCWDKNPENRPDFDIIVKAFESGQLEFPGTDHKQVEAYLNQFTQTDETVFNAGIPSPSNIGQIMEEFSSNLSSGIMKLMTIISDKKWHPYFKKDFIAKIIEMMNICDSLKLSFVFSRIVNEILKSDELKENFFKFKGNIAYLNLFLKYGVSTMPFAIENLTSLKDTIICHEHFVRFAPFLISSNIQIRIDCAKYITKIIVNMLYDKESSVFYIVPNVLANTILESPLILLRTTLDLLSLITKMPNAKKYLETTGLLIMICQLFKHDDCSIVSTSLSLYSTILSMGIPLQKSINSFFDVFPDSINKLNEDNLEKLLSLNALILFKSPKAINEFYKSSKVCNSFIKCIYSNSIKVALISLKTLAGLFLKNSCFALFKQVFPQLICFLKSENDSLKEITLSILTLYFQNFDISIYFNDEIKVFLITNLRNQNKLTNGSLQLCGAISSTYNGTIAIEECIPFIIDLLSSKYSKLSMMVLTFISTVNPLSPSLTTAIPIIFKYLARNDLSPYPLKFAANITICNLGAVECSKYISVLLDMLLSSDVDTVKCALIALERTFETAENQHFIDEDIHKLISYSETFLNSDYNEQFLPLIYHILASDVGQRIISQSKLPHILMNRFHISAIGSPQRQLYIKILSRINEKR